MSMPETTVYKHCYFLLWKYKIRMTSYWIVASPSNNTILFEYLY